MRQQQKHRQTGGQNIVLTITKFLLHDVISVIISKIQSEMSTPKKPQNN